MKLNKVQTAAFELIQSDARFLYSLVDISQNANNIESNYIMMCQPYIGVFVDGAEKWCKKMKFNAPRFDASEKEYYIALRQGHKLFEKRYSEFAGVLMEKLEESERYFYSSRSLLEKIIGYNNVGADLCNGKYCGNTILCAAHTPLSLLDNKDAGHEIRDLSIIAGKLAAFFDCQSFPVYSYDDENNVVVYKNYHFFKNCPLREKSELGLVLFSILCNINYVTVFIENYFTEEIPQKFKFAYLQYYYLCSFMSDLNQANGTKIKLNASLCNRELRNSLAHYGLGQYMSEKDILSADTMKGLTIKALHMESIEAKQRLFDYLTELRDQIESIIFV